MENGTLRRLQLFLVLIICLGVVPLRPAYAAPGRCSDMGSDHSVPAEASGCRIFQSDSGGSSSDLAQPYRFEFMSLVFATATLADAYFIAQGDGPQGEVVATTSLAFGDQQVAYSAPSLSHPNALVVFKTGRQVAAWEVDGTNIDPFSVLHDLLLKVQAKSFNDEAGLLMRLLPSIDDLPTTFSLTEETFTGDIAKAPSASSSSTPDLQATISALQTQVAQGSSGSPAAHQQAGTPTPSSSSALNGRLGGAKATLDKRFGHDTGQDATIKGLGYHVKGFGTVVVIYANDQAVDITIVADRMAHTPLSEADPADWTPAQVDQIAKKFLPLDVKTGKALDTGDGRREAACVSAALGAAFDTARWKKLHAGGKPGECHFLLSPDSAGNIYQIEVGIGRSGSLDRPTPTAVPTDVPTPTDTPPPTATEDPLAKYTPLADARELEIRPGSMFGTAISFYGTIFTIQVAPPGRAYDVGDSDPQQYSAVLQVYVTAPDGTQEPVVVGYNGDTAGMYVDSAVMVYGTVVDTDSGTNAFGGSVTQPLVAADNVVLQ